MLMMLHLWQTERMIYKDFHLSCLKLNMKISSSSSTIRLRPLGLLLPPINHLPISFVVFLCFFFLQVCNVNFLGSLLSSILCICSLQFIVYCGNLSLILKMPNCSLMSLLLFLSQSVYPVNGFKNFIPQLQFSSCLIGLGTSSHCHTSENWVDSALDWDYWRGLVNAALNLRVP